MSADPGCHPDRRRAHGATETLAAGSIFVGAPIEHASEREVVAEVADQLDRRGTPYVLLANFELGGRQIDCVIATADAVVVVEAKTTGQPIRGEINGPWQRQDLSGGWRLYTNARSQALGAKNALRDAMAQVCAIGSFYPAAAVVFVGGIPAGSSIPPGDFKVAITTLDSFNPATVTRPAPPWDLSIWRRFAASLSLAPVSLAEAIAPPAVQAQMELLKRFTAAVSAEYGRDGALWLAEESSSPAGLAMAAREGHGCLITGPSGCGKSLMAKWLVTDLGRSGGLVFYFSAKDFAGRWADEVRREIGLLVGDDAGLVLSAARRSGREAYLVLDGVNELGAGQRSALRGFRALANRLDARVVLTSQSTAPDGFEGLTQVAVKPPSLGLKLRIAERAAGVLSPAANGLLGAVSSGIEAEMVGEVGGTLPAQASRLTLIDRFVRRRLGAAARNGALGLRRLAAALHDGLAFSIVETQFDELMREHSVPFSDCDAMFDARLLIRRGERISFSHEMLLNGCAAFAIAGRAKADPEAFGAKLSTPLFESVAVDVLAAIEDPVVCRAVLEGVVSPSLIAAAADEACGVVAGRAARNLLGVTAEACADEIRSVTLEYVPENRAYPARWGPAGRRNWTTTEVARLEAIGMLADTANGMETYLGLCQVMDQKLSEERLRLAPEVRKAGVGLRSGGFALAYYRFGDAIGFSRISHQSYGRRPATSKLDLGFEVDAVSSGQLHFFLESRRALSGADDPERFAKDLTYILRHRFSREPYHVQLATLSAVGNARDASPDTIGELIGAINGLDVDPNNWAMGSSVIDALGILGGLDDDAEAAREGIVLEVRQALSDDEAALDGNLSLSVYTRTFDHPFSGIYAEVVHGLDEPTRHSLYRRALAATDPSSSMSARWLCETITDLEDPADGELIGRFAGLPEKATPFAQDAWAIFTRSVRFLGRHGLPLPAVETADEDTACLACLRTVVVAAESERAADTAAAAASWRRLHAMPTPLVMGCFSEMNDALTERRWGESQIYSPLDLTDAFPLDSLALARRFIGSDAIRYYRGVSINESGPRQAFGTIARLGDRTDLPALKNCSRAHRHAAFAIAALKALDLG